MACFDEIQLATAASLKVTYFPAKNASLARYRRISGRTRYFVTSLTNEVSSGSEKLRAPRSAPVSRILPRKICHFQAKRATEDHPTRFYLSAPQRPRSAHER